MTNTQTEVVSGKLHECLVDIARRFHVQQAELFNYAINAPYAEKRPDGKDYPGSTGTVSERRIWYAMVRILRPNHMVECGVNWGVSTIQLLSAMRDNHYGTLTSVDVRRRIENDRPVAALVPGDWRKGFRLMAGWDAVTYLDGHHEKINFFFEDTNHTYDTTRAIYEAVQQRLAPHAICISHDPISRPDVVRGIRDAGIEPVVYQIDGSKNGITIWRNQ